MRRVSKTDANHASVMAALRKAGASVVDASKMGRGFPDLVCGYRGQTILVEVKDGAKAPSARKLTNDQLAFIAGWKGSTVWVVTSEEEALRLLGVTDGGSYGYQ